MSGTSLDGLDIALCNFSTKQNHYHFEIVKAQTVKYNDLWHNKLANAHNLSAYELALLNNEYGKYLGQKVIEFLDNHRVSPATIDFISSHGHTVYHNPPEGITLQIGDGTAIYAICGIKTIYDFRRLDIYLNGQGAPLVPVGDRLLFAKYPICLNLGGFANVSYLTENKSVAFDIVPVNIVLNSLARQLGLQFDIGGVKASEGSVDMNLLEKLNSIEYYRRQPPKSLGREWVEAFIDPLLRNCKSKTEDILRTYVEHISLQIGQSLDTIKPGKILVTGGGAYNTFLMSRLTQICKHKIVIPQKNIIEYKEALIFAFLGYLKTIKQHNIISTVTGASRNSISGIIVGE